MRTLIFIILFITAIGVYNACRPRAEKVDAEKARLETAEHDFKADYDRFSASWMIQFRQNKSMADLIRSNSKKLKGDEKLLQEKLIKELEKKNQSLNQKLKKYNYRGVKDWEVFKTEFTSEANTLEQALKDVNKQAISP